MPAARSAIDYPNLRRSTACPLCGCVKDPGLLTCWPCFRHRDGRQGFSEADQLMLHAAETLGNKGQGKGD